MLKQLVRLVRIEASGVFLPLPTPTERTRESMYVLPCSFCTSYYMLQSLQKAYTQGITKSLDIMSVRITFYLVRIIHISLHTMHKRTQ